MAKIEIPENLGAHLTKLPAPTVGNVVVGFLGAILFYVVCRTIYYLYLSPLRHYPGPKLWAISRLPWNYVNMKGRITWRVRELHEQYGPVVRIAPDELSFTSSAAWKKIYGQRSPEFPKALDGRGIAPAHLNGRRTLMTESQEKHSKLRRAINPAFSERALREQEDYFQTHSDSLVKQLMKRCKEGPVDMSTWFNLLAFDIVSDLAFGTPAGCLNNADQPWIRVIMSRATSYVWIQLAVQYGVFEYLSWITPRRVTEARKKHMAMTEAKVRQRIEAKNPGKDFMSYILDNKEEKLSNLELVMLAGTFIVAGSGTTAGGMSGLTYLLLRSPEKLEKLKTEIRETFKTRGEISMVAAQNCKYLRACLNEAMRMYPPTPGSLPRWVPGKGEIIDGHWVPGGYAVAVNQFAAGHSKHNFHRASEFIPERWLELSPDSEFANDDLASVQPFSYGQRICIGKPMAYAEMSLAYAKFLWHFELELDDPSDDWWIKQGTYIMWEKAPLMIKLRLREGLEQMG
ncbi:cytochrome p-450 [Colletotrichum truncatum]|uniref:Cytochrome p-450 n=1 Tax=Colletotrichum truncatum TaxID=5467 RepID=A0ACC3ZAQ3_COLTU|nr:cytochrome p-450 [Colletotrichum truncatum]KAF6796306.1 cytochrome p-450 [Colletotrichum truncatum]